MGDFLKKNWLWVTAVVILGLGAIVWITRPAPTSIAPVVAATPAPAAPAPAAASSTASLASDERVSEAYRLEQEMCEAHLPKGSPDTDLCQKVWQRGLLHAKGVLAAARAEDEANQARREYERRERELVGALEAQEKKADEKDPFGLNSSNVSTGNTLAEARKAATPCGCMTLQVELRPSCEAARRRAGMRPCSP